MQSESEKPRPRPMRETMPTVAAFIDAMRDAFGAQAIDQAIRDGMAGQPGFYAEEGGRTIGTRLEYRTEVVVHPEPASSWRPR